MFLPSNQLHSCSENTYHHHKNKCHSPKTPSPKIPSNSVLTEPPNKYQTDEYILFKQELSKATNDSILSFRDVIFMDPIIPTTNKLLLTGDLFRGKELIIDNKGLKNGLRKKKDGQTFFGISSQKDYTGNYYNDYIIKTADIGNNTYSTNCAGRLFDISYSKKTGDYQLYMINNNIFLYYFIEQNFYIEKDKDYMILLGKVFLTITQKENADKKKILYLRLEFEDNDNAEDYNFSENDTPITIGRKKCTINIDNTSLSKVHAIIQFSPELKKFYFKDNKSTNGSIFILKEDDTLKLKGQMKFKLNEVLFRIMELP